MARVPVSYRFRPNSKDAASCTVARTATVPLARPIASSIAASLIISATILPRSTPSARRIPISLVRYDITPYRPNRELSRVLRGNGPEPEGINQLEDLGVRADTDCRR